MERVRGVEGVVEMLEYYRRETVTIIVMDRPQPCKVSSDASNVYRSSLFFKTWNITLQNF